MARDLPLTYGGEVLRVAMAGRKVSLAMVDLAALVFTAVFFGLASWTLVRRVS